MTNNVGLCSYANSDKNSIGKVFTQDEIRDIIISNLRGQAYIKEEQMDNIIAGIKQYCYLFLDDENTVDDLEIDVINHALNFLNERFVHLTELHKSLNLKYYSWPMTELAQTIDEFTLSADKHAYVHEVIDGKLMKDITSAVDIVSFSFGVMKLMKKEKEKRIRLNKIKKELE